ncbi:MAG: hypothetical protein ABEJ68_06690 [Halobacteriaceae archaeon]
MNVRRERPRGGFLDALDSDIADYGAGVADATLVKLRDYFLSDFVGYGPVDPFIYDSAGEDLSCNGSDRPAYVFHADHGDVETNRAWGADRLDGIAARLAQRADRHLSAARPLLTTTLPDGSRIQLTLASDVATRGSNFTLRKFREEPFTPTELVDLGTFSVEQMGISGSPSSTTPPSSSPGRRRRARPRR